MIRSWLALLALLAVIAPVKADMYPDGSNAKLPATGVPASVVCVDTYGRMNTAPGCGYADLRQWGAVSGANVDAALDQAIAYACANHVPLYIPLPPSPYELATAHVIGNGSPTSFSTCNKVTIFLANRLTPICPAARRRRSIRSLSGPARPVLFRSRCKARLRRSISEGIGIDCAGICKTGFKIVNTLNSEYAWLGVTQQVGPAFILTSTGVANSWQGGLENDWFHDLFATLPRHRRQWRPDWRHRLRLQLRRGGHHLPVRSSALAL